ncbi:hypothetical protein BGW39_010504 [Mortierella sp. 14UC]|nr:hypothetical protein BGW39_010504 [Mortierella sp. 14UC]
MTFTQALWRSLPTTTLRRPLYYYSSAVSVSGTAVPDMALRRTPAIPRLFNNTTSASVVRRPFHATATTKNPTSSTSVFSEAPSSTSNSTVTESIGKSPVIKPLARRPRNAPRNTKWTPELDEVVLNLRRGQRTWEAISQATGRSTSACSDRYYTALDPALRNWTPAMFAKLNQMVEDGAKWSDIAIELNAKIVACQNQWRTLGNGKYRIKGIMATSQALLWAPHEIELFWDAWIRLGEKVKKLPVAERKLEWKDFAAEVRTKTANECRIAFRLLVNHALKDAPGWVKLETASYVQETTKAARSRKRLEAKEKKLKTLAAADLEALNLDDDADLDDDDEDDEDADGRGGSPKGSLQKLTAWTDEEHTKLFEAVERYGLFSGWTKIRNEVKPNLDDDAVEAEYYHISGAMTKPEANEDASAPVEIVPLNKKTRIHGEWSEQEAARLSLVLMKYSNLPVWTHKAQEMGVLPAEEDYDILFRVNRGSTMTKRLSKKELKALELAKECKRKGRGRGKKFLLKEAADAAAATTANGSEKLTESVQEQAKLQETIASPVTHHTAETDDGRISDVIEKGSGLLWNADRTLRLRRLVGQQQLQERSGHKIDWAWIAEHIGPGFDASTCITKWQTLPEHSSIKVEPARFWDEADIKQLEQGVLTYGNSWILIQKNLLPERTTDSIRRKVSNLQKKREELRRDAWATAVALKEKYPDLDVEETVKTAMAADPHSVLWGRLEARLQQYRQEHGAKKKVM